MESSGKFGGEGLSIRDVLSAHDEFNKVVLLNVDGENLTSFVDADHSVGGLVPDRAEDKLVGDPLSVDYCTTGDLVHVEVAHLGHNPK